MSWSPPHAERAIEAGHSLNSCAKASLMLSAGTQLLGMAFVTMVFAVLGFLSPANRYTQKLFSSMDCHLSSTEEADPCRTCRGGLMTAMLLLFVFMGIFGGYSAGRLYKTFKARALGRGACMRGRRAGRVFAMPPRQRHNPEGSACGRAGGAVEEDHAEDGAPVPWGCLRHLLHPQPAGAPRLAHSSPCPHAAEARCID